MKRQCKNCDFWDIETDGSLGDVCSVDIGYCRAKAPVLIDGISEPTFRSACCGGLDHSLDEADYDYARQAIWPETREQDWCGEFLPRRIFVE